MRMLLLGLLLVSHNLFASIITYDEAEFYSKYTGPSEVIDFSVLKDGTTYLDLFNDLSASPYSVGYYSSEEFYIYENAWSDNLFIRGQQGAGYIIATWWDGNSIRIDDSARNFSILNLSTASPIALNVTTNSYSGFLGIIPESSTDLNFTFGNEDMRINSLSYGYSDTISVPEPPIIALMLAGLIGLGIARRKIRK